MKTHHQISVYGSFLFKSTLIAPMIMFSCMALGEIVYDKNLFSGFLHKPSLWVGVLVETVVATLLMTVFGALVLSRFKKSSKRSFASLSAVVWCLLGILLIGLYSHFYWTREWHITSMAPGLFFGWILPGLLSIVCFVWLSLDLRVGKREPLV